MFSCINKRTVKAVQEGWQPEGQAEGTVRRDKIIYTHAPTDKLVSHQSEWQSSQGRSRPKHDPQVMSCPRWRSKRSTERYSEYGQYSSPPSACVRVLRFSPSLSLCLYLSFSQSISTLPDVIKRELYIFITKKVISSSLCANITNNPISVIRTMIVINILQIWLMKYN